MTTNHELNVQAGKLCDDAISTDGTTVWMWQADISDWREFSPATSIKDAMDLLELLPDGFYIDPTFCSTGFMLTLLQSQPPPEPGREILDTCEMPYDQFPLALTTAFVAATKAEASR